MKKFLNNKGFTMTELLISTVVILGVFSLLFANFLPIMTRYENMEGYNNVTSYYAAFHLRKLYLSSLNDPTRGLDRKAALNSGISKKNYYEVYDGKQNLLCASFSTKDEDVCKSIIREYGIEKVLVTNYNLENLKSTYPKEGEFYSYINYLPRYKSDGTELYRLLIKTKDYGFATTGILSDYKTNSKCFIGSLTETGIEITDYLFDEDECNDKVVLASQDITVKDKNGNDINGVITRIGDNCFKDKKITSIIYPSSVKEIGDYAFKNTNLESFKFNNSLNVVGKEAFSNTNIHEISIPYRVYFGDNAFSNNSNLTKISFDPGVTSVMNNNNFMTRGLFKNCGNGKEITLNIPKSMEYIGDETFLDTYVINLDFGNMNLKGIGKKAFYKDKETVLDNFSLPNSLITIGDYAFKNNKFNILNIPKKVKSVGSYAFVGSGIKVLNISSEEDLTIEDGSFKDNDIENIYLGNKVTSIGNYALSDNKKLSNIKIPQSLKELGEGAFMNTKLGDKEGSINTSVSSFTWCKVLFNSSKCRILGDDDLIKLDLDNKIKYINVNEGGLIDAP